MGSLINKKQISNKTGYCTPITDVREKSGYENVFTLYSFLHVCVLNQHKNVCHCDITFKEDGVVFMYLFIYLFIYLCIYFCNLFISSSNFFIN